MIDPQQALAAAVRPAVSAAAAARRVLVIGGGGPTGSAIVEQLLGGHRFERVAVVAAQRVQPALRGLLTLPDEDAAWRTFAPDTAVLVFDRQRHANGRDDAFVRPSPEQMPALAARLRALGVRALLVAVPHSPAMLPQALKAGLANLDEAAAAAMGFDHLTLMRLPQNEGGLGQAVLSAPARLARWLLRQLHWMVPQAEQPVRAATVARVVAALAHQWPQAATGTRVLPPEVLWHAAQGAALEPLLSDWLAGRPVAAVHAARQRW